jgi:hypothetical protein
VIHWIEFKASSNDSRLLLFASRKGNRFFNASAWRRTSLSSWMINWEFREWFCSFLWGALVASIQSKRFAEEICLLHIENVARGETRRPAGESRNRTGA